MLSNLLYGFEELGPGEALNFGAGGSNSSFSTSEILKESGGGHKSECLVLSPDVPYPIFS